MKWKIKYKDRWQKWFAYVPVRIGNNYIWWEWIQRAHLQDGVYEYAELSK